MTLEEDLVDVAPHDSLPPDAVPVDGMPAEVMDLLRAHLPLSLLVDLALGAHVRSEEVFAAEPADDSWLRPRVPASSR